MFTRLTLWYWILGSSLGKTISLVPSIPQLAVDLCFVCMSHDLTPDHVSRFIGVILVCVRFTQPWQWDFMSVASDTFRRQSLCKLLWSSAMFLSPLPQWSPCLRYRSCVVDVGKGLYNSEVLWVVVFCNGDCMALRHRHGPGDSLDPKRSHSLWW